MRPRTEAMLRLGMAALFVGIGALGAILARDFTPVGQWFPFYISMAVVVIGSVVLVKEAFDVRRSLLTPAPTSAPIVPAPAVESAVPGQEQGASRRPIDRDTDDTDDADDADDTDDTGGGSGEPALGAMLWWWVIVVAFALAVYLVGPYLASVPFIVLTLRFAAGVRWRNAILGAAIFVGVLVALGNLLQLRLPSGLIG